ncbi:peptidase rhomboid domain protein : Peptidase S54, rhomboid domain protein OS=Granulicella mallensis (strain ATCC BAA-1857 / DSM 23137 / MP5ACTX8) GN=AciX8_4761 PE=4 SV=1: Rhomboid [Gemmata massiliana]|uniref:Peptidase S54 rhomboid domain-containing protein n=1 Tax=Gemmata massiliana TaxID=1210884 RepID=A0A6P2DMF6_9BACT|nr:rhomboid family intramembrane serine protease [Gemmata massiliana]VTS03885.1 peptidase rhomboid domain protein : Peptidase S54, rhomboid domain protein OS=Granulicella mallensis (strain ATCC BAA-1857 / DSM 23137 / MP5ACTX8) GN=AciX8_4761 PE=4 SV=1: Rhomboid [Gemmata massiliana]
MPISVQGLDLSSAPAVPPAGPVVSGPPTAASVLFWIAASEGLWFPSRFAAENGISRDSLDDPLTDLRLAGLIATADWVRGLGQGYTLTPTGKTATTTAALVDLLKQNRSAAYIATLIAAPDRNTSSGAGSRGNEDEDERDDGEADRALRPPLVIPVLLMANALWFFICAVWGIRWGLPLSRSLWSGHTEILHRLGAVTGLDLIHGEWWRLITCCFVHIGALHLLLNMFALAMMGPLAELLWGRRRLLIIYFVSGLGGSALAMALRPEALLAGASGAIWGIQMSLFAWLFTFRRQLPPHIAADWFRRLTIVFLLNAAGSFLPNVSWEGHLGGGLAGFAAAGLLNVVRFGDRPRRLMARALLVLLPLFCLAGLASAMDVRGVPKWRLIHQRLATDRAAREAFEQQNRVRAALDEFEGAVGSRLITLTGRTTTGRTTRDALINVTPGELNALLVLRGQTRTPESRARSQERIKALKKTAEEVAELTTGATGVNVLDQSRERVHRFALARAKSFELLLGLLDSTSPPTGATWAAWQAARLDADRLWEETIIR